MKNNQLKAGVVLAYVNIAANAIVALCYTPVMLRLLGQSEYGLYTLVASVVSCLSLFNFGAGGAYLRFYSRYKVKNDEDSIARLNGTFMGIILVLSLLALICGGILTVFSDSVFGNKLTADELQTTKALMALMVINMALTFPNTVFNAIISSKECYIFQRTLTLVTTLLGPFVTLPLLFMGYKSVMIVVVSTVLTVGQIILNIYYCKVKIHAKFKLFVHDTVLVREIFFFSFFIFLNMVIDQINWSVDKFLLGRFHGTGEVAIYGVASQINAVFLTFSTSISSVFAPRINRLVAEKNGESEINRLFVKIGRVQMIVISLIATGFIFFGRRAIELWAGENYSASYAATLLLILPTMIPLIQNLGIDIQRAKNKHKFRSVAYLIIATINVVISIPLCKAYGSAGSALGTAIAVIIGNGFIMNWYYQKHLDIDIKGFWVNILKFIPAFIAPAAVGIAMNLLVNFENPWVFLICVAGYTGIFMASMWMFGMNSDEQALVRRPIAKLLHK